MCTYYNKRFYIKRNQKTEWIYPYNTLCDCRDGNGVYCLDFSSRSNTCKYVFTISMYILDIYLHISIILIDLVVKL